MVLFRWFIGQPWKLKLLLLYMAFVACYAIFVAVMFIKFVLE